MTKIRLLERVRHAIRVRQYSISTEKTYISWIKRFILFHDKRHPTEMEKPEIEAFLTHLAINRAVSPAPHRLAVSLLYGSGLRISECLRLRVGDLDFSRRTIRVHSSKGGKDRVTVMPFHLWTSFREF